MEKITDRFWGGVAYDAKDLNDKPVRIYMYQDKHEYMKMLIQRTDGKKINAIKLHRANTGSGLKEAKEFVESISTEYVIKINDIFKKNFPEYLL